MALHDWPGREITDPAGVRYGRLDDVFVGRRSGEAEFGIATVPSETGDGTKRVAVPLRGARETGDVIALPLDPARVRAAPAVTEDVEEIPPAAGAKVLAFFGLDTAAGERTRPMLPVAGEDDEAAVDLTLSQEELTVEARPRAVERVRVRKHVVFEDVTVTVSLAREELVIEREPLSPEEVAATSLPGELGEGEDVVIVLHAEEPVIGRRTVPVERVRLHRDTVVEDARITDQVRKERVEVDHTTIEEDPA